MINKQPRPRFLKYLIRGGKIAIAAELGSLVVSYLCWRQLNTNQDLRYYMFKNHNWILESYYKVGETISGEASIRNFDTLTWKNDGRI